MRIGHLALWCRDLEGLKAFYETRLGGVAGPHYHNPAKNFTSYFLRFEGGASLELMHSPHHQAPDSQDRTGWAHLAFEVESEDEVDRLSRELQAAGVTVLSGPRRTGDGYYESLLQDPEGNLIELVAARTF